jgi:hypothetical protein
MNPVLKCFKSDIQRIGALLEGKASKRDAE